MLKPPDPGQTPSPKQMYERMCWLNGVTDPEAVKELWAKESKRRADRKAKEGERKPRRKPQKRAPRG